MSRYVRNRVWATAVAISSVGVPAADAVAPTPVAQNFQVLGHTDLGGTDTNGDIWVHGQYAYVGNWLDPCTGNGVRVVNVADPRRPRLVGTLAARAGTWAEDPVVRRVSTAHFTGDLLAVGIMRCGTSSNLDRQTFGAQLWDVTDPRNPRHLSSIPLASGRLLSGARELDVVQRGGWVYVLAPMAFTSSEWFDKPPAGDVRIIDVTDPRDPRVVASGGHARTGCPGGPISAKAPLVLGWPSWSGPASTAGRHTSHTGTSEW